MARHSFSGSAVQTYLTSSCGSTDAVLNVADTTNWPDTNIGPFVVIIDPNTSSEEKALIDSYTSSTIHCAERGYDDTTAVGHEPGSVGQVVHVLDATQCSLWDAFVAANGTVAPSTSAVGDSAQDGVSLYPAAADHKHARESFVTGETTTSMPGDTENDGISTSPARADHKHGREPALATPLAGTLGADQSFSSSSFVTFLTTVSFGIGTWSVDFSGLVVPAAGGNADVQIAAGTATASFLGPTAAGMPANGGAVAISTVVEVTAPGTLVFQGRSSGSATAKASTLEGTPGCTGYVGVQL